MDFIHVSAYMHSDLSLRLHIAIDQGVYFVKSFSSQMQFGMPLDEIIEKLKEHKVISTSNVGLEGSVNVSTLTYPSITKEHTYVVSSNALCSKGSPGCCA